MSFPHITSELVERIDQFGIRFHAARMRAAEALPGNPYGISMMYFGDGGIAAKAQHPLLHGRNRIYGFRTSDLDLLDDLIAFYRSDGLMCKIFVPHRHLTQKLFLRFSQAGLWSTGNGAVPAIVPADGADDAALLTPANIHIRLSEYAEKEQYLDIFQEAFADREERDPEYRAFQWAEDSLPDCRRYIAENDNGPVGMASFPVIDGVGYFGSGGVIPAYRRMGLQRALIRRRIADAVSIGCTLVLGGGSPGATEYRNFERAGLRLIPSGSVWREIQK